MMDFHCFICNLVRTEQREEHGEKTDLYVPKDVYVQMGGTDVTSGICGSDICVLDFTVRNLMNANGELHDPKDTKDDFDDFLRKQFELCSRR